MHNRKHKNTNKRQKNTRKHYEITRGRGIIKETLKDLWKEMLTPLDGKKTNWWLNGLAAFILFLIFIGVMTYG